MLYSVEARWFFAGRLPPALLDWLAAGRPLMAEAERVDHYLLLPAAETLGVKLRQGRLEIKRRIAAPRPFHRRHIAGRREQWSKWSFALESAAVPAASGWVAVVKRRRTQRWAVTQGRFTVMPLASALPVAGCNLEWTEVQLPAHPTEPLWFTLGLEAYGAPEETGGLFQSGLGQLVAAGPPPGLTLSLQAAASYPAWLSRNL